MKTQTPGSFDWKLIVDDVLQISKLYETSGKNKKNGFISRRERVFEKRSITSPNTFF